MSQNYKTELSKIAIPLLIHKIKHSFERLKKDCLLVIACFQKTNVTLNSHIPKLLKKTRNLMKKFKKLSKNYCRKKQKLLTWKNCTQRSMKQPQMSIECLPM